MTDPISRTQLENAATDAHTLERVTNAPDDEVIVSRLGRTLLPLSKVQELGTDAAAAALATQTEIETMGGALFGNGPVLEKRNAPPGSPADGDSYLIGNSPTGAWAGKARNLTKWLATSSSWIFLIPRDDQEVHVTAENRAYRYAGGWWQKRLFSQPGASFISFDDFPDGTLASAITKDGSGKAWHVEGAGAASETVTSGKMKPTINAVGGNCYNILKTGSPNYHVEAWFQWDAAGAANYSLSLGKGNTIIDKMIHVAAACGANMDITLWGASFVSTFMGVDQPNILEQDIPGGVTLISGGAAIPVAGERFKISLTVHGDCVRACMFNSDNLFVQSKSFKWEEVPDIVGDYSYSQSQGANAVAIISHAGRPVDDGDFLAMLPPLWVSADPNAAVIIQTSLVHNTFKDIFKLALSTAGNADLDVNVSLFSNSVPNYAAQGSRWRFLAGSYSGSPGSATPLEVTADRIAYSQNSGVINIAAAATAWNLNQSGTDLTYQFKGSKTGTDPATDILARFTFRSRAPAAVAIQSLV